MKIVVPFNMSPGGMHAMNFAWIFAASMVALPTLIVPAGEREDAVVPVIEEQLGQNPGNFDYASSAAAKLLGINGEEVIFVSSESFETTQAEAPQGAHLFLTQGENGTRTFGEKPRIAVPFGDGESALESMRLALLLIKKMQAGEIVLMHTTYPNQEVASDDPREHMKEEAQILETRLLSLAREAGVRVETKVDMADDLVHFVIMTAIECECTFIIVAEGSPLAGGYAEQIAVQANLPVLVIRKEVVS